MFKVLKFAACILLLSVAVIVITHFTRPKKIDLQDDPPFDEIFAEVILASDVYSLSDAELESKYQGQTVYASELPESEIRYFILTDDDTKTQKIAVRGTHNIRNVIVDAEYGKRRDESLDVYLHHGFQDSADEILKDALPLLKKDYKTTVTGHSLGGAVAAILMMHLDHQGFNVASAITFGQPKVTNTDGARLFSNARLIRVINRDDIVTKVPPGSLIGSINQPFQHFAPEVVMLEQTDYVYRKPKLEPVEKVAAAVDQLGQEETRGLWDDYLDAHRIVNYVNRIQAIKKSGTRITSDRSVASTTQPESSATNSDPKKLAVLVGINEYKDTRVSKLNAAVSDVHAMKNLLIGKYDFAAKNVRVLTDAAATREQILQAIQQNLIDRATTEDVVVFYFSGHGSQIKDVSGDEPDDLDETILTHDSRTDGVFDISDDELNALLRKLPTDTNLTVILDCCHSGSGLRNTGGRFHTPDTREPPTARSTTRSGDDAPQAKTDVGFQDSFDYTMISASLAVEDALEFKYKEKWSGVLSYFLIRELGRDQDEDVTYRSVMRRVQSAVGNLLQSQHPQIEGSQIDQPVFGATKNATSPYITISLRPDGTPVLMAGAAQGMTKGSQFDVYSPTTNVFDHPNDRIAKIELTEIRPFTSELKVFEEKTLSFASRAVERSHAYAGFQIAVHAQGESDVVGNLKQSLGKLPQIRLVDTSAAAQVEIIVENDELRLSTEQGLMKSFPISPDPTESAVQLVQLWSKWFNLLLLDNPESTLKVDFQIGGDSDSNQFAVGQKVPMTLRNRSDQDVYFAIIDLESTGNVSVVYPGQGQGAQLGPGKEFTIRPAFSVPDDRTEIRDFLKVIVTSEPIDVHFLESKIPPTLRSTNPLQAMLSDAAFGSRDAAVSVDRQSWGTVTKECIVRSAEPGTLAD